MATINASPHTPTIPLINAPLDTPAPSLDEMHHALSHIVCEREYRAPSTPTVRSLPNASPDNKHLQLLNLLSLLLVTSAERDVAAVMFRVCSNDRLELHYTKNGQRKRLYSQDLRNHRA